MSTSATSPSGSNESRENGNNALKFWDWMTVFKKNDNSPIWLQGVRNPLRLSTLDSNLSVKVRH